MTALRIGTRSSRLARAQAQLVADALHRQSGRVVELVDVTTHGDTNRAPLRRIGGTGVFVAALRDRLLAGEVDIAVHSFKDLPTALPDGLVVAAVPERDDPRDALVASQGRSMAALPAGARVGTGSPRRAAQLAAARPDLDIVEIRGNIDTRLGRVLGDCRSEDRLDAVVLAYAGLRRIDRADVVTEVLEPDVMLPAPAQGALAVECRTGDDAVLSVLAAVDHDPTRAAVTAERALLATLEAGCAAPVGALAYNASSRHLELHAAVLAVDGSASIGKSATGPVGEPEKLGRTLAEELIADGAAALMGEQVS